jgi:predicted metal-binding protein
MSEREGEFARYKDEDLELMALGNCGDCPGVIMPKVTLMNEIADYLDRDFDTIHLGTCVVKAKKTGKCPLDFEQLAGLFKQNFGKELVVGTHDY